MDLLLNPGAGVPLFLMTDEPFTFGMAKEFEVKTVTSRQGTGRHWLNRVLPIVGLEVAGRRRWRPGDLLSRCVVRVAGRCARSQRSRS